MFYLRARGAGKRGELESYHHALAGVSTAHERIFAQYADRCQLGLVVFPATQAIGQTVSGLDPRRLLRAAQSLAAQPSEACEQLRPDLRAPLPIGMEP